MHKLEEVLEVVNRQTTVVAGLIAILAGLRESVQTVVRNAADAPTAQEAIDKIFEVVGQNTDKMVEAMRSNTDAAPPPASVPVVDPAPAPDLTPPKAEVDPSPAPAIENTDVMAAVPDPDPLQTK